MQAYASRFPDVQRALDKMDTAAYIVAALPAALIVGMFLLLFNVMNQLTFDFFLVWSVLVVALVPVMIWSYRRTKQQTLQFLDSAAPRIAQAQFIGKLGLLVSFDNGLFLQARGGRYPVFQFRLFLADDGSVLQASIQEHVEHVKERRQLQRMRMIGSVSKRKGDPRLQSVLAQTNAQLGARFGFVFVAERRTDQPDRRPVPQKWMGIYSLRIPKWMSHSDAIRNSLDGVASLIQDACRTLAARPRPLR